jgi:transposase
MREGVEVRLRPDDLERLEGVVGNRNSLQHHVWRARIVLMTVDGAGTMAIRAATGKGKPTIWRWQARCMQDGADGLFRDAPRGRAFAAISPEQIAAVIERTLHRNRRRRRTGRCARWRRRAAWRRPPSTASGASTA